MTDVTVSPARSLSGTLKMPGDKSISHRYAMLAALAEGTSYLGNFSTGADCASTLACVEALGARVTHSENGALEIAGCAGRFRQPDQALDCGNSGSTMRMLTGLLSAQPGEFMLIGDSSLTRRPMKRIEAPLRQMHAEIELCEGCSPIKITGRHLHGIEYEPPVPSAQVKTAVLFAGMQAKGPTILREAVRTRDHGELALRAFGAQISRTRSAVRIEGGARLQSVDVEIPGDLSSAAFFLCAASLFPDSNLVVDGLGLNPTRAVLLDVLGALGVRTNFIHLEDKLGELRGMIHIDAPNKGLAGASISNGQTAQLIDELPVLAAIAPYTREGISIRNASELRVKESDRLALIAKNLHAMGAKFQEHNDGIDIPGGQTLHGAEIDSGGDHRIAMAFAVAALRAQGQTLIRGAECTAISFPEFFDMLEQIADR